MRTKNKKKIVKRLGLWMEMGKGDGERVMERYPQSHHPMSFNHEWVLWQKSRNIYKIGIRNEDRNRNGNEILLEMEIEMKLKIIVKIKNILLEPKILRLVINFFPFLFDSKYVFFQFWWYSVVVDHWWWNWTNTSHFFYTFEKHLEVHLFCLDTKTSRWWSRLADWR